MAHLLSRSRYMLLLFVFLSGMLLLLLLLPALGVGVGINYGRLGDNLPPPSVVAARLRSLCITRVKIYDADPDVIAAFNNTDVELTIAITNAELPAMADDPGKAPSWVHQNLLPHLPHTLITSVTVGNEVLAAGDAPLASKLLPAMQAVHSALVAAGLDLHVAVTTPHAFSILSNSYPPSAGSFKPELAEFMHPLLDFHEQIKSPFLVNIYPFFAYKGDPGRVSLPYALLEGGGDAAGVTDPESGLHYDNMLYAQVDAVYSALEAMGHPEVEVKVAETGWPSVGDEEEAGATVENARAYNGNLVGRVGRNEATPKRPLAPVDAYVFALFNENRKPGPASERNYGLFYPDWRPVYHVSLRASSATSSAATSHLVLWTLLAAAIIVSLKN